MAGCLHEASELGDRHRRRVHPESVDCDLVNWAFFRIEVFGAIQYVPPGIKDMFFGGGVAVE